MSDEIFRYDSWRQDSCAGGHGSCSRFFTKERSSHWKVDSPRHLDSAVVDMILYSGAQVSHAGGELCSVYGPTIASPGSAPLLEVVIVLVSGIQSKDLGSNILIANIFVWVMWIPEWPGVRTNLACWDVDWSGESQLQYLYTDNHCDQVQTNIILLYQLLYSHHYHYYGVFTTLWW